MAEIQPFKEVVEHRNGGRSRKPQGHTPFGHSRSMVVSCDFRCKRSPITENLGEIESLAFMSFRLF
ncbi:hypothetical protein J2848_005572 [Azospirillum lipoferum]|uniref:hypothetical protein n=1 Tax=Azospirillum TaxID=191 RepID=UPI0011EF59AE|nr:MULTISPECIES: hypothetical protein [Azospirillum]MCP1613875.1 hypothetical protein [Azospirillum lipoferum]MDW5534672.1 hypothetical protein [Azospirillum sp. NL1]